MGYLLIGSILYGCGAAPDCAFVSQDQKGSFMAPLRDSSVQVAIDSSFSPEQQAQIASAVAEWNRWGQATMGQKLFETTVSHQDVALNSTNGADECTRMAGDSKHFSIVQERDPVRWSSLQLKSTIPAATVRCSSGTSLVRQAILINTKIAVSSQFKSIVLHELGHALGLDHSCIDGQGKADHLSCAGLAEDHEYRVAVLYPILQGSPARGIPPETKELIRRNDDRRAACLLNASPEGRP